MTAVAVSGLRKTYGDHEALRGIDFTIASGEVFGLLGPNGAGKTTTVEILEGYRRPDSGEVSVLGVDPQRGGTAWRERIGVMLQSSSLYPNLTVRESLGVFAGYYAHPRNPDEVIEIIELGDKADARVRTLSGGQQRRLDLGLALIGDPELIFLDEPTTGFDPGARRTAWQTVAQPALAREDDPADHALPRRSCAARRPRRRSARRLDRAGGNPGRADRRGGRHRDPLPTGREDVVELTRDPTRRLHELTSDGDRARRGARGARGPAPDARGRLSGPDGRMRLFVHELRAEQILFWRNREAAFFTFLLPVIFFLVFGSIYGSDRIEGIRGAAFLEAGMIGYGVASTAFAGLAITMVIRRESGVLKRIRATPLPPSTYIVSVLASTFITFLIEAVILIVLGRVLFSVGLPARPFSLFLVLVVGAACFAALGLGLTGFVRSAEGSSAVVNFVYLPMAIISGTFFSPERYPGFLRAIAEVLPLTHFTRLTRDVMIRHHHVWSETTSLAVVLAWGAAGLAAAIRGFRWQPRES